MTKKLASCLFFALTLIVVFSTISVAKNTEEQNKVYKVGIVEFDQFIIKDEKNNFTGYEVEFWQKITEMLGMVNWEFVLIGNFKSLLNKVERGEIDFAISGITKTYERAQKMGFTESYLTTGLSILVPAKINSGFFSSAYAVTKALFWPLFSFFLFVLVCAHVLWWAEKDKDDSNDAGAVNDSYFPGIFEALYWVIVTCSTVGYGDIAPKKWLGRVVSVVLILVGITFFCTVTAQLSSSLTVEKFESEIKNPKDLFGKTMATLHGTTSVGVIKKFGAQAVTVLEIKDSIELLENKSIDGIVFDEVSMVGLSNEAGKRGIRTHVINGQFNEEFYAIAFRKNIQKESPHLIQNISMSILKLRDSGYLDFLGQKWLKKSWQ